MKIVVLTPPEEIDGEAETIAGLFENGLERLHVRKPGYDRGRLKRFIESLPHAYYDRMAIHSHHDLVAELGLGGVHLPERVRTMPDRVKRPSAKVSTSFHTLSDLAFLGGGFDYAFLSPVYDSISKPECKAVIASEEIKKTLRVARTAIFALGGITPERCRECSELGFDGVAVIGAVWNASQPLEAFMELQSVCQPLAHASLV